MSMSCARAFRANVCFCTVAHRCEFLCMRARATTRWVLHYLMLFFYWGTLGTYEGFSKRGRDEYVSMELPQGMPEWAPSSQNWLKDRRNARAAVRAYFHEAWQVTAGIVFGFQIAMCVYQIFFNHRRRGRLARPEVTMPSWTRLNCMHSLETSGGLALP